MAWNRSAHSPSTRDDNNGAKSGGRLKTILAGCAIVGILGAVLWYLLASNKPSTDGQPQVVQQDRTIKAVTPSKPKPPVSSISDNAQRLKDQYPELKIPDNWDKPYPPQAYRPDGSLKRHSQYVSAYTNSRYKANMSLASRTFSNTAERDIALILNIKPGSTVVGNSKFGKKFVESFIASLDKPITYDKDDTEEQRALKDSVKAAKKELKAAYDRGEDIAEIMNETRQQYKELGLYRQEIKQMVSKAKLDAAENGGMSEKDRRDLISAANLMLKERGCEPLSMPDTFVDQAIKDESNSNEKGVDE